MKKKIFVKGPVLSQSGYGEQSIFALRGLRSREDLFDIYIQPIPWGRLVGYGITQNLDNG